MEFNFDFPKISPDASDDVKKIARSLALLAEQLRYVLSNLDEGNFSDASAADGGKTDRSRKDTQ